VRSLTIVILLVGLTLGLSAQAGPTGLSHVPYKSKAVFSHIVKANTVQALPAQFDLRVLGRMSPIRDQGQLGTCWSFAVYGALESNVTAYGKDIIFSEEHLKNNSGFARDPNWGGNQYMAMAYMARWAGPVPEALDPYTEDPKRDKSPVLPPGQLPFKIQAVDLLPPRDVTTLKRYLMENGAVYTSIMVGDTDRDMKVIFNESTASLFNPKEAGAPHAVTIVGWDDNFPKDKFRKVDGSGPRNNGAFIVRNSWGMSWGDHGYFYISYEDANATGELAGFVADGQNRYSQIYQYDVHGTNASISYESSAIPYAVKFTARGDEDLQAVGLFTAVENVTYTVSAGATIEKAAHAAPILEGTLRFPGYHVLPVTTSVPLSKGKDFYVVVHQSIPDGYASLPLEQPEKGYVKPFTPAKGVFFYAMGDEGDFVPLEDNTPDANIPLKVMTTSRKANGVKVSRLAFEVGSATLTVGERRSLPATVTPSNAADATVVYTVQPASVATVDEKGTLTAVGAGTAELRATSADKAVSAVVAVTVVNPPAREKAITFGDPSVERAVRNALGVNDRGLTLADLAGVSALSLAGKATTLAGIELLPGLTQLDLEGLQAKDLAVLGSLKALKTLSLVGFGAGQLNKVRLPKSLEVLDLSRTDLSGGWGLLAGAPNLQELVAVQSSARDVVALGKISSLRKLDLRNNRIASVAPLAALPQLASLLLAGNPADDLSSLASAASRMTNKDFNAQPAEAVIFADHRIEAAVRSELGLNPKQPLTKLLLTQVETLDLTKLKDKSPLKLGGLESLTNLYELDLPDFGIIDASVIGKLINLESLDLGGNQISNLGFVKPLGHLAVLDLSDNQISDIGALTSLQNLEELSLAGNQIRDARVVGNLTQLTDLDLSENQLKSLEGVLKLKSLEFLDVSSNQLGSVAPLKGMGWLDTLFVRDNPAQDVVSLAGMLDTLGESDFEDDGTTFDPNTASEEETDSGSDTTEEES